MLQYKWIHKKSFQTIQFWWQNYWAAFFWVHLLIIILVLNVFQWTWYRWHALWNRTIRIDWMLDSSNCELDTYRTLLYTQFNWLTNHNVYRACSFVPHLEVHRSEWHYFSFKFHSVFIQSKGFECTNREENTQTWFATVEQMCE